MPLSSLAGSDDHTGAAGGEAFGLGSGLPRHAPLTAPNLGAGLQTWEFSSVGGRPSGRASRLNP